MVFLGLEESSGVPASHFGGCARVLSLFRDYFILDRIETASLRAILITAFLQLWCLDTLLGGFGIPGAGAEEHGKLENRPGHQSVFFWEGDKVSDFSPKEALGV